jgi:phosphoglycolate phosphatase-like HAD superfamily hydrolase
MLGALGSREERPVADQSPRRLVLWDVDYTLMTSGGMLPDLYGAAFRSVTGQALRYVPDTAGRTERAIALDAFAQHGIDAAERHLPAFVDALAAAHTARLDVLRRQGRALAGAAAALEALHRIPGVVQSLLTGNIRPIAEEKLAAFGLDRYVDFDVAAYGTDHVERADLVGMARRAVADRYGVVFGPENTVLLGDTPNDVAAGRTGGARVVAVATGRYDRAALAEAGADVVLADLRDTAAVVAAVLG